MKSIARGPERHPVLVRTMAAVDDQQVAAIIEAIRDAPRGTLRTRAGTFGVRAITAEGDAIVLAPDDHRLDIELLEIDSLEFCCGEEIFAIDADALTICDGALQVPAPQRIYCTQRRGVELGRGVAHLRVTWDAEPLELSVIELASDEIVVEGPATAELDLCRRPATLRVTTGDGDAEIPCEVSFRGFGNECEVRLRVHLRPEQRAVFARVFARLRFPRLLDRGAFAAEAVIDLFRASHYLDLRGAENQPTASWCRPEFAGNVSIDRVYQADDGVLLGHVSVTRAYSRTWLGHQLSTLKGHPQSADCRLALYHHFASIPTLIDGRDDVYLLGYYDRSLRWHRLFFEGFVEAFGDASQATLAPFDRFEPLEFDAPANSPDAGEFGIAPALEHELEEAAALVRAQLPELAHAAFDIDAQRLEAEFLHPEYAREGVERSRRVLVARERGELVGVALCEAGSADLSLFNLFNLAQVYVRPGISRAAHVGLFRAARSFYAARGVVDPVIVAPPGQLLDPSDAGLRLDETMGCIIWSGRTLERYQSYVRDCFAKLDAKSLTKAS